MGRRVLFLPLVIILSFATYCSKGYNVNYWEQQSDLLLASAPPARVQVFTGVNVIPMDTEEAVILENCNVYITDAKISRIVPASGDTIAQDVAVIDASGRYLIPGLADMHLHLGTKNDLLPLIANGVTTVRNMSGFSFAKILSLIIPYDANDTLKIKRRIEQGSMIGPRMFTSGAILESSKGNSWPWPIAKFIDTPEAAKKEVASEKKKGYDFIKLYHSLDPEIYRLLIAEAHAQGLKASGHIPRGEGFKFTQLLEGPDRIDCVEHLRGYIDPFEGIILSQDELAGCIQLSAQNRIWNCPTLVVNTRWIAPEQAGAFYSEEGMRFSSPRLAPFWHASEKRWKRHITSTPGLKYSGEYAQSYFEVTRRLYESGAPLLLGTDAPFLYCYPGFAVHEELRLLVKAGLTPYAALRCATYNPAVYLSKSDEFGSVRPDMRADLILTDKNPLEDITSLKEFSGIMVNGRYFEKSRLDTLMEGLARHGR